MGRLSPDIGANARHPASYRFDGAEDLLSQLSDFRFGSSTADRGGRLSGSSTRGSAFGRSARAGDRLRLVSGLNRDAMLVQLGDPPGGGVGRISSRTCSARGGDGEPSTPIRAPRLWGASTVPVISDLAEGPGASAPAPKSLGGLPPHGPSVRHLTLPRFEPCRLARSWP